MTAEASSIKTKSRMAAAWPPLTYLGMIILATLCIPLWYFTGLDQFIPPFIGLALGLVFVGQRIREAKGFTFTKVTRITLLFVLTQAISGLFIVEREFYIVFLRNILAWVGGLALYLVLINVVRTHRQLRLLMWGWAIAMLMVALVGLVAFLLQEDFQIKTLALYIVPGSMRDGVTASTVWTRSFLAERTILFGQTTNRIRSFFLYANSLAAVLVWTIPFQVYLLGFYKRYKFRWLLLGFIILLSTATLLLTTSRAGILSFLGGLLVFCYLRTRRSDRLVWWALTLLLIAFFLSLVFIYQDVIITTIKDLAVEFVTARGKSHVTRFNILYYSLLSWSERPIFGWGSPREMALYGFSSAYPRLGSHSQLLSVLYRHGIVGFAIYIWWILTLFRRLKATRMDRASNYLRDYLSWFLVSVTLHSILFQLDLDLMAMFVFWQILAVVDITPRLNNRDTEVALQA